MKTWFITGAARGLGRATAEAALKAGYRVVATGRDRAAVEAALGVNQDRLLAARLDVTDEASIAEAVRIATDRFGGIDVLVNNAGYGQLGAFEETSREAVERQFATNVFGVFAVTRAVLPTMRAQRSGHVVTISSMVGAVGADGASVYAATKFAVSGWSESLCLEVARFGIHATAVYPGYFRTDFLDGSSMRLADLSLDDYAATTAVATERRASRNHRQSGDPAAFARAMIELVETKDPPVWFVAGSDSLRAIRERNAAQCDALREWEKVATSTDYLEGA
jgi:NAD(P)-dependent dehydrogenase (short-subunit alcohol dehydrogenase family)